MKKILFLGILLKSIGVSAATSIFVVDWNPGLVDGIPAESRRYTTFTSGGSLGTGVAATNANVGVGQTNPGPGFYYLPTGISWAPNTLYTVDFLVFDRASFPQDNNAQFEFGLWSGLPVEDTGAGDYVGSIGPGEVLGTNVTAMSKPALGVLGQARMTDSQVPNDSLVGVSASSLDGAIGSTFATGPEVSGLHEMVLFLRVLNQGTSTRGHWDMLTIEAVPIPEPSSSLLIGASLILGLFRRR